MLISADVEIEELCLDGEPLELGANYKDWEKSDSYTVPDSWGVLALKFTDPTMSPLFRVWTDSGFFTDQLGSAK